MREVSQRQSERRAHRRSVLRDGHQQVVAIARFGTTAVRGTVLDISLGGMKVECDQPCNLSTQDNCIVRFTEASEEIQPHDGSGTVVRTENVGAWRRVAIEFDVALDVLDVD